MTEFIVNMPDEEAELFIARFGINGTTMFGYQLVDEIVRCKDCKYGYEAYWPKSWNVPKDYLDCTGKLVETWDYYNDEPKGNPVPPDGFCKWGEQKALSQ